MRLRGIKCMAVIQWLVLLLLGTGADMAAAQNAYDLWPTVLFVKGQDLCQFEEGFGATRKEQVNDMVPPRAKASKPFQLGRNGA